MRTASILQGAAALLLLVTSTVTAWAGKTDQQAALFKPGKEKKQLDRTVRWLVREHQPTAEWKEDQLTSFSRFLRQHGSGLTIKREVHRNGTILFTINGTGHGQDHSESLLLERRQSVDGQGFTVVWLDGTSFRVPDAAHRFGGRLTPEQNFLRKYLGVYPIADGERTRWFGFDGKPVKAAKAKETAGRFLANVWFAQGHWRRDENAFPGLKGKALAALASAFADSPFPHRKVPQRLLQNPSDPRLLSALLELRYLAMD